MMAFFDNIQFAQPWLFLLLGLIPLMIGWMIFKYRKRYAAIRISALDGIANESPSWRVRLLPILFVFRLLAVAALITAIARPQSLFSEESVTTEGIDIVLALDVSTSMLAADFKPSRIEAAKETAIEFINGRPYDRIGLVVFAGEAFTQCPITLDHELLKTLVIEADEWQLKDGTALGDGLWMSLNRIIDTTALQSKVVILLTDGVQTAGEFAPIDAARAASDLDVRIYTIGIGSITNSKIPVRDKKGRIMFELDPKTSFDEPTLQEVAAMTGGKYFRATSKAKLRDIYEEIDKLEKEKIEVNVSRRYSEKFYPFAWLAVLFIFLEILLGQTVLRTTT